MLTLLQHKNRSSIYFFKVNFGIHLLRRNVKYISTANIINNKQPITLDAP